jgi:hypothetical protein
MVNFPEFASESATVQEIVASKPDLWEYRLVIELLRNRMRAHLRRWRDLKDGAYSRPRATLSLDDFFNWLRARMAEAVDIVSALEIAFVKRIPESWGPPGVPGHPEDILYACSMLADVVQQAVDWEERVRFVFVPDELRGVAEAIPGPLGYNLEALERFPSEFEAALDRADLSSGAPISFDYNLKLEIPDGWSERVTSELRNAERAYGVQDDYDD